MDNVKTYVLAFAVGGAYAVIGQALMVLWVLVLGPDSSFIMPLTLLSMGVVAFVLYLTGVHQKIAPISGYGSILPFNGFACAVADCFENVANATGSSAKGAAAAITLVIYVVGIGGLACVLIGIIAFFLV